MFWLVAGPWATSLSEHAMAENRSYPQQLSTMGMTYTLVVQPAGLNGGTAAN